jgi:hypothetical protein
VPGDLDELLGHAEANSYADAPCEQHGYVLERSRHVFSSWMATGVVSHRRCVRAASVCPRLLGMGTIDSEVREPDGGRDLPEVIRAEFAHLEVADTELVGRLEAHAVAVAVAEPESGARVALAVVEGAHEFAGARPPVAGPTVGELSTRQLIAAALRPRRTTEPRS